MCKCIQCTFPPKWKSQLYLLDSLNCENIKTILSMFFVVDICVVGGIVCLFVYERAVYLATLRKINPVEIREEKSGK